LIAQKDFFLINVVVERFMNKGCSYNGINFGLLYQKPLIGGNTQHGKDVSGFKDSK
jgi:hypothetical protein